MKLTNRAYDVTKYTITIFLPAVGALYYALAQVWDFDRIPGVNGTINALITFGGLLIGYSTKQYKKTDGAPDGDLVAQQDPDDGTKYLGLAVNAESVDQILAKDHVVLKVVDKTATDPRMAAPLDPPMPTVRPGTNNTSGTSSPEPNPAINRYPQS